MRPRRLPPKLPQVESQPIFRISGLVKTLFQQRLYSFLRSGPHDRCKAGIPPGCDLDVGRQAGRVHETLGIGDRLLVERGDPRCECIDEIAELGIRQRPIHVAKELRLIAAYVV